MTKRICDVTEFGRLSYNLNYRKTFEIEIINEFQSAIYSKMLNFVLNNEFDKSDSKNLQTNLLNQLSNMNQINLFKLSLEELEAYHEYLRAIKKYADSIT
ncbi:antitoxin epsilon [Streptococcus thermophilus]|uniref:antitoxin epsilon n=1 Tax=Streptococcus thermophilus TaxID=1308 RepID=UPI0022FE8F73|nr:antitoxin epsilon [Streptococcus thermophilus]MDA5539052.1 antitoxin epsilon [Streptococcus thermophilus]MDA5553538.1 antitoxin epsilon [Streptococcus thermophilus]WCL60216.1 antitoxin epsilon [Streptococcus thermophilus]